MAQLVEILVVRSLVLPVLLRRDDGGHALVGGLLKDGIGVVALIGNQMVRVNSFNQAACLCASRPGTFCKTNSDRQTKRIHGQMYLGRKPPLVRLMS